MNYNSLPQGVRLAVEAAQNKKAAGISVLDLSGVGAFTSYFVICTGFSTPQVQAICTEVEEQLYKELGRSPEHREGRGSSEWALLDFGSFIVHAHVGMWQWADRTPQAKRFQNDSRAAAVDLGGPGVAKRI